MPDNFENFMQAFRSQNGLSALAILRGVNTQTQKELLQKASGQLEINSDFILFMALAQDHYDVQIKVLQTFEGKPHQRSLAFYDLKEEDIFSKAAKLNTDLKLGVAPHLTDGISLSSR